MLDVKLNIDAIRLFSRKVCRCRSELPKQVKVQNNPVCNDELMFIVLCKYIYRKQMFGHTGGCMLAFVYAMIFLDGNLWFWIKMDSNNEQGLYSVKWTERYYLLDRNSVGIELQSKRNNLLAFYGVLSIADPSSMGREISHCHRILTVWRYSFTIVFIGKFTKCFA